MSSARTAVLVAWVAITLGFSRTTLAQPYARFAVPDSALDAAVRSSGNDFENQWNALFVSGLRAGVARADSAKALAALARRVADAEPRALGSHLAGDALALSDRWSADERRRRLGASVAESLATVARAARDYQRADSLFSAALTSYRGIGEHRRVAWVLGSLAAVAQLAADLPRADSLYRLALVERRRSGDARMIGNSLNDLGTVNYLRGRYAEAYPFLQEARTVREASGQTAALSNTFNFLGLLLAPLGQPDSARVCFEQALAITASLADSARTLPVLTNYTKLLADLGNPRAEAVAIRGIALAQSLGDRVRAGILEHNLGDFLRQEGRFTDSIRHLGVAADLHADAPSSLAEDLNSLGAAWIELGDPVRARPPLQRALALADSLRELGLQARCLVNLSQAALRDADAKGAQSLARKALGIAETAGDSERVHEAAAALGRMALERDELDAAEHWYLRSTTAGAGLKTELGITDMIALGTIWQRGGRLGEAERELHLALDKAEQAGAEQLVWASLGNLGDIAEHRGDNATALAFYRRALARIERMRSAQHAERQSITLFARRLYVFEAVVHLLNKIAPLYPDSGYAAEAFLWAERSRSRSFLDLIAAHGAETSMPRTVTLEEAQRLLPSDRSALLEYSVGDSSTSLWVIRRDGWKHFTLPARAAFLQRVRFLRQVLSNPVAAAGRSASKVEAALYQMLVAPAASMLEHTTEMIVAPDGVLALVPFEALLTHEVPEGRTDAQAYLVSRFEISYTPSASALAATSHRHEARPVIIAVGDPRFTADSSAAGRDAGVAPASADGRGVPEPLPGTAAEIAALAALAGPRHVIALTGADASRERLLGTPELHAAEVIHVATHGDVNEAEPELSGLWLAPDSGARAPSRITVGDISQMRLVAAQVTLSACETGLGRLEAGEGVVGLSRAFLAAGARSVLVSLWKVNDLSTASLMTSFYRGTLQQSLPRARALARAKRALLASPGTRSPFYWAPFVIVGDGGRLRQ